MRGFFLFLCLLATIMLMMVPVESVGNRRRRSPDGLRMVDASVPENRARHFRNRFYSPDSLDSSFHSDGKKDKMALLCARPGKQPHFCRYLPVNLKQRKLMSANLEQEQAESHREEVLGSFFRIFYAHHFYDQLPEKERIPTMIEVNHYLKSKEFLHDVVENFFGIHLDFPGYPSRRRHVPVRGIFGDFRGYGAVPLPLDRYGGVLSSNGGYGGVPPANGGYGGVPPANGGYGGVPPANGLPLWYRAHPGGSPPARLPPVTPPSWKYDSPPARLAPRVTPPSWKYDSPPARLAPRVTPPTFKFDSPPARLAPRVTPPSLDTIFNGPRGDRAEDPFKKRVMRY